MYRAKEPAATATRSAARPPREALRLRLSQAGRLRRALDRDEFELHYQPLVRPGDGAMLGVEALIRWHDRERGLVGPDAFIPLAERTGAITRSPSGS